MTAERADAPRRRRKTFLRKGVERALHELMRLRLAVWLLIVMAVLMIVGSIFPQGYGAETYIVSWGEARYNVFSRLGLLNLFHTKLFKLLGIILLLNLIVCSIMRLSGRRGAKAAKMPPPADARRVAMGGEPGGAVSRAVRALTERGYFVGRVVGGMVTARRGPWPEGVSLLYHLALAIAIIGFFVSALHSFEGDVTLYPEEPVVVQTGSVDTGWQRFRSGLAGVDFFGWHPVEVVRPDTTEWGGNRVTLTLNEFRTEWELYQDKYYPKDWISDIAVEVKGHGPEVYWPSRLVEVNRPLRAGGLTFYQMAYEQEFDVVVWRDGSEVERVRANAYVPFTLESIEGMFFPGTLRVGTLYQKYRETEPVVPHIPLKWQPPQEEMPESDLAEAAQGETEGEPEPGGEPSEEPLDDEALAAAEGETTGVAMAEADTVVVAPPPPPPPEQIELGDLSAGTPLEVEGFTLTLENPYEGSVLTYRHDPGVVLLYIAITLFILGLAIRTYWPSYRVSLWVFRGEGGAVGRIVFRATGILGEPEAAEDELVDELERGPRRRPPGKPGAGAAGVAAVPVPDALPEAAPEEETAPEEAGLETAPGETSDEAQGVAPYESPAPTPDEPASTSPYEAPAYEVPAPTPDETVPDEDTTEEERPDRGVSWGKDATTDGTQGETEDEAQDGPSDESPSEPDKWSPSQ